MKRSLKVPLIMLGTIGAGVALTGCGPQDEPIPAQVDLKQEIYESRDDCVKEWGASETYCQLMAKHDGGDPAAPLNEFVPDQGSGHAQRTSSTTYYAGPRYFWHREGSSGYPVQLLNDGSIRPLHSYKPPQPGSGLAKAALSSQVATPRSYVAARQANISRGGFGSRAGFSGGG